MKATHKKEGTLTLLTRVYEHKFKERMYLSDNGLWYFESDLNFD